jgi:4-hydroxy-tetrahydrodipicolinate reductase
MGQQLLELMAQSNELRLAGGVNSQTSDAQALTTLQAADVIISFCSGEGSQRLAKLCKNLTAPKVLECSTDLSDSCWQESPNMLVILAPNTAFGVWLMVTAVKAVLPTAEEQGFDILISETHHRHKRDAPSGTAKYLQSTTGAKLSHEIVSLRGGSVAGEHTIHLLGEDEEITITHRAYNRRLFAKGAIKLAKMINQSTLKGIVPLGELGSKYFL